MSSPGAKDAIRRANADFAYALVHALADGGVRRAIIAPGSRSTPIVIALSASGFALDVVHDERAAAYCALGIGRASEEPAVVVTTSGTATANLHPAILEASRACVPLIVLTADRPLELIESGANQTVDQRELYGRAVRAHYDLAAEVGVSTRAVSARVRAATRASLGPLAGPVHINARFRKPLEIEQREGRRSPSRSIVARVEPRVDATPLIDFVRARRSGAIVVGSLRRRAEIEAAREIVTSLAWPTHASVLSGLRCARETVPPPRLDEAVDPAVDGVLWIGGPTVSTRVDAWLAGMDATVLQIGDESRDAEDRADAVLPITVEAARDGLAGLAHGTSTPSRASAQLAAELNPELPFEARAAVCVAQSARSGEALFVGNSSPIRDVDRFAGTLRCERVFANRGASGIDGGIATACGIAKSSPVTALLGDLSFLHDASSLALGDGLPVRIVVIDNCGGGLFHRLEIAQHSELDAVFRRYIVAPHQRDLVAIAAAYGADARRVEGLDELARTCASAPSGLQVLVLPSEAQRDGKGARRGPSHDATRQS